MTKPKIPFNVSGVAGREQLYITEVIASGHLTGDGPFTKRCHAFLEETLQVKKALLTTSCTHALEMAALLLDLQPGDEVIIPSYTFVSTANPVVLRGAKPVFADIRPDTINLDENKIENLITERTRAIFPIHYGGVGCEMDKLQEIARRYNLAIVEDNAQGLFATYKDKPLGSFGEMATVSFHGTKNFVCGEGGVLLVNDPAYIERAEILREKGTNRSRYFRGQVDKYTWVDVGSSYLPSELLAAFLYAQLEARTEITARRKYIFEFYAKNLQAWAAANSVQLPYIPDYCQQSYHLFYMVFPTLAERQRFIAFMRSENIDTPFHYQSLHLSEMGLSYGYQPGDFPVTEHVSDCLVRLPFYKDLTDEQLERVVQTVQQFEVARQPASLV